VIVFPSIVGLFTLSTVSFVIFVLASEAVIIILPFPVVLILSVDDVSHAVTGNFTPSFLQL
jgi:hypothetical protein